MANVDKDIERLIVRSLDKALSEDEELRLNRELIRNPQAQRLMEEYKRIDELAGAALHDALDRDGVPLDPDMLPSRTKPAPAGRYHRGWWLVPGAIAAALLALVLARFPVAPSSEPVVADRDDRAPSAVPLVVPRLSQDGDSRPEGYMRNAGMSPTGRHIRRDTGREVIGVVGEDGNIYWIEVDRIRTIRQPGGRPSSRTEAGEM